MRIWSNISGRKHENMTKIYFHLKIMSVKHVKSWWFVCKMSRSPQWNLPMRIFLSLNISIMHYFCSKREMQSFSLKFPCKKNPDFMCTMCFWDNLLHVHLNRKVGKPYILEVFGNKKTKGSKQDSHNISYSHLCIYIYIVCLQQFLKMTVNYQPTNDIL
jgi:hypothetical protein